MSIDQIARRAGAATRDAVQQEVDVEACLATLHATRMQRRQARLAAVGVAAAAVIAAVVLSVSLAGTSSDRSAPANVPGRLCLETSSVRCLPDREYVVRGVVPYRFQVPRQGFIPDPGVAQAPYTVDVYQTLPRNRAAGVTVLSGAYPAGQDKAAMPAAEFARWVAGRKFLAAGPVERTVVGGLPAWRVDVAVRAAHKRVPTDLWCNSTQYRCFKLTRAGGGSYWETGPWLDMVNRYLFVQAPNGQTVVVWSWAFKHNFHALDVNDELIRTIDFGAGG